MSRWERSTRQFWLTWSPSRNDWIRQATGETLSELQAEARFFGVKTTITDGPHGVWFEFVPPRKSYRPRSRRRR
jgi:hypothetical protein